MIYSIKGQNTKNKIWFLVLKSTPNAMLPSMMLWHVLLFGVVALLRSVAPFMILRSFLSMANYTVPAVCSLIERLVSYASSGEVAN